MPENKDIHIRDPFVLPMPSEGKYYMFGTTGKTCWGGATSTFLVHVGSDLKKWEGPLVAFDAPPGFWADQNFWAPEVHEYRGRYYMFASFKADGLCRATQILVADHPLGPFVPNSDGPVTPAEWECLDGTLFVDEKGKPWMVFCHEWVQVHDGQMCAMPLTDDLRAPAGPPVLLFTASQLPVRFAPGQADFVTDGPFLYRTANGTLLMLWSSGGPEGYCIAIARSTTGTITGPWRQQPELLYSRDGGHAMIFRTLEGRLMLSFHGPNNTPHERPLFVPIREDGSTLVLEQ